MPSKEAGILPSDDKINLGRLADIFEAGKNLKSKITEMIEDLFDLEKDIAKLKVEMDSAISAQKVEEFLARVDKVRTEFESS